MGSEVVHASRVEHARGIEGGLEPAVDLVEGGLERMEDADRLVAATEKRRVAAGALRGRAHREHVEVAAYPSQPAAPLDELRLVEGERLCGLRQRDAPER